MLRVALQENGVHRSAQLGKTLYKYTIYNVGAYTVPLENGTHDYELSSLGQKVLDCNVYTSNDTHFYTVFYVMFQHIHSTSPEPTAIM